MIVSTIRLPDYFVCFPFFISFDRFSFCRPNLISVFVPSQIIPMSVVSTVYQHTVFLANFIFFLDTFTFTEIVAKNKFDFWFRLFYFRLNFIWTYCSRNWFVHQHHCSHKLAMSYAHWIYWYFFFLKFMFK